MDIRRQRAQDFGAMEIDLKDVDFTPELLGLVPAEYALKLRVLPISARPGFIVVAVDDPSDLDAIDSLQEALGREVELCVAHTDQLNEFIARLYGRDRDR
jgi:hypothetical protein